MDINPELPLGKRLCLQQVLTSNQIAFGFHDRLGHLDAKVQIPLITGTKPISLPPFPSSPVKREVIDKQMDKWIQLGVIKPSKSPWATPAFIVYRNGKPRMVVDYQKLNKIAISGISTAQTRRYSSGLGQKSVAVYAQRSHWIHSVGGQPEGARKACLPNS